VIAQEKNRDYSVVKSLTVFRVDESWLVSSDLVEEAIGLM
jgi:hypothetical protein